MAITAARISHGSPLSELANPNPLRVADVAGRDEIAEILETHRVSSLPVVDFEQRIVGVIRYDALFDAVEREAVSTMQSMVGVSREERALSRIGFSVRKRLPWLQINLVTAFVAAAVVGLFEDTIAQFTALAVLLPVVAGQSGNAVDRTIPCMLASDRTPLHPAIIWADTRSAPQVALLKEEQAMFQAMTYFTRST